VQKAVSCNMHNKISPKSFEKSASPPCPFPFGDNHPHLIHPSIDRPHSPSQTASGSNQLFCHNTLSGQTDRQTYAQTDRLYRRQVSKKKSAYALLYRQWATRANNTAAAVYSLEWRRLPRCSFDFTQRRLTSEACRWPRSVAGSLSTFIRPPRVLSMRRQSTSVVARPPCLPGQNP